MPHHATKNMRFFEGGGWLEDFLKKITWNQIKKLIKNIREFFSKNNSDGHPRYMKNISR